MAAQRSNQRHPQGGQHAATIGDSTMHHKSPWDFSRELQRAGKRFDIDSAPDAEPQPTPDEAALEEFNRELQRAIGAVDWSQAF